MRGKTIRELLALVAAALICAAVSNALAGPERKLKWVGQYGTVERSAGAVKPAAPATAAPQAAALAETGKEFPPHPDQPWVEVSGDDAAALRARGGVLFVDARRSSVYRDGHIAGARSMAIWEADVDNQVKALYEEGRDQNEPIVVYCSGGDCEDSHLLSQKLFMAGFNNVLVYKDGFPDWQKRGLPVAKVSEP